MKKTVGVFSLIVMLLSQVFSPFVYAVTGEEVPIPEPVVEEVISEPEVVSEVDNSTGDNNFEVVEPSTGEVADVADSVNVEVNTGTVISTGEETKNLEGEGTEASSGFIEKITETIKDFLGINGEENENFESKKIYGTGEYEGVKVEVYAQTGLFASGTELTIEPVVEEKLQAVQEVLLSGEVDLVEEQVIAFDITFRDPETQEELQPKDGTVQVKFNYEENESLVQAEEDEEQEVKVYHLNDIDEEGEKIEEITGAKLEEVIINEEKSEEENVMVVEANSFSIYTIVQQVKEEGPLATDDQLANFEYGEISIARPDSLNTSEYPIEGFTIMDRNLGAVNNDITNTGSYGYHYQWGNNYGYELNKSASEIVVSVDINGWIGDNPQGPCVTGWHIPSVLERSLLLEYYAEYYSGIYNLPVKLQGYNYNEVRNDLNFQSGFMNYFKIPFGGYRYGFDREITGLGTKLHIWSSTLQSYGYYYYLDSDNSGLTSEFTSTPDYLFSVRCFKDTYSGTGDVHTITFNFNGGSGSAAAINVLSGEKAIEPEIPIKEGYEFLGWYKEDTYENKFNFDEDIVESNIDLYARWIKNGSIIRDIDGNIIQINDQNFGDLDLYFLSGERIEHITIMDRNMGANSIYNGDYNNPNADSIGYFYQRGNNYGFGGCGNSCKEEIIGASSISQNQISKSIWPSHIPSGYGSNVFVLQKSRQENPGIGDGLWGGTGDTLNKDGEGTTFIGRKGPCPDGYHVPSVNEWSNLYSNWIDSSEGIDLGKMSNAFLLPPGGRINVIYMGDFYIGQIVPGSQGRYWSSSSSVQDKEQAYLFSLYSGSSWGFPTYEANPQSTLLRAAGSSVRCLKNQSNVPVNLYDVVNPDSKAVIGILSGNGKAKISFIDSSIKNGYIEWKNENNEVYSVGNELEESFNLFAEYKCNEGYILSGDNKCYRGYPEFLPGKEFNKRIKSMVNGSAQYDEADNVIQHIEKFQGDFQKNEMMIDVSSEESGYPIYAWFDAESGTVYYYSEYDGIYLNKDSSYMFSNFKGLRNLDLHYINSLNVQSLASAFYDSTNLKTINMNGFDTKNLLSVNSMFGGCPNLEEVYMESWDWSNNEISKYSLTSGEPSIYLYASGWIIPEYTTNFVSNFNPKKINVTNWRFPKTNSLRYLFTYSSNLSEIEGLESRDTSKITDMYGLFDECSNLKWLDLSNWDTSNVLNMSLMFYNTKNLKTIYVGNNFNVNFVTNSSSMFNYSDALVGGNGTIYDSTKTDKSYAKIDRQGQIGYFTDPSHFAIRFKAQGGEEITTQWIATGGTAQALTGRLTYYNYYTGDDLLHKFDLTTPLYAYTEIYASGVDAYELKFYSGDEVIYTGYVTGDNNSKLITIPENPEREGYDFAGWIIGSTSTLFDSDQVITSDLELHGSWDDLTVVYEGTTGCYDYRSYYEGGEYLAEITNYRRDNTSCLGNNLILPDVIKRNGRDYKVVSLGEKSFKEKGISGLLTLPQYLKVIENMAFMGNSNLTGVVFNDNLESIGNQSFQGCGLKSLSFPASLSSIGDISFTANTSLTSLSFAESTNTLAIGNVAFNGCSLEEVNIPSNVTSIGNQAFEDNPLKTVRVLSENVTIGGSAFKAKNNSIETLVLSGGGDLTYLMFGNDGETIFNNLTSLKLGNGVTKIGNDLFKKTKLQSVRIPGSVKLLDSNSFASNDLLQEIVIEEGLKTINPGVFSNNKKLKTLIIPNSVTDISGNTLNNNPELESVKFGNGIERLQSILENCPSLNHLDLGNVKELYSTISGTQLESLTIPASMVTIGSKTFEHNPNLTSLVFEGNSLITIGTGAFNDTSITNILLPNSLTTLGNGVFCSDSVKEPGSIVGMITGATAAQIESLEAQDNTECLVLKKDKYTLTYNAGAHSGLVDNQQTLGVVVDYNGTIQLTGNGAKTATSQKGYTFLGWTTELNGTVPLAANTYTITGDVTLYPVFKKDSITKKIKFYKNGNEGYTYNGNDYTEDQEFILCTIQERYNADEDITTCSENIEFPMGISENTPVTRGWTRNIGGDGMLYTGGEQIEVTSEDSTISYYLQMYAPEKVFKANYEYGSGVEELTITSGSCMIAETINGNVQSGSCEVALPELNVLTGYHTPLWYKKGEDITYPNLTITLTGDEILEAKAIANSYTVVYQPGEGTGEMESQEFEYDKAESLNKNKYRKEGYHFSGWIDMLGKEYRDGEKVLNLLTEGVLELTAQWLQNPPAAGGGQSITPATKEQEHNAAEEKPEDKQESNQDKQQDETVKDESKTPENTNTSNQTNIQQSSSTSSDNLYKTVVDPEIQSAYEWAYERDVTTIPSLDDAMPDGVVKRGHLAKMVVNYATNVLGREIPEKIPSECRWNDWRKDWESEEIKDYAVKSCALGLMGLDMPKFLPNMEVTRAQFGTIMSRLLWGKKYAGGTPYYRKHLNALKENNIMTQIENPERRVELRQWVWLMLMRSAENN